MVEFNKSLSITNPKLRLTYLTLEQQRDLVTPTEHASTLLVCKAGLERSPKLTLATRIYSNDNTPPLMLCIWQMD